MIFMKENPLEISTYQMHERRSHYMFTIEFVLRYSYDGQICMLSGSALPVRNRSRKKVSFMKGTYVIGDSV